MSHSIAPPNVRPRARLILVPSRSGQSTPPAGLGRGATRRRRWLGAAILGVLILLGTETTTRAAFTFVADHTLEPADLWRIDAGELGWEPRPGFRGVWGDQPREIDAHGFFATDSAKLAGPAPRIIALGAATTYGLGVRQEDTFVERLDRSLGGQARVINLGVCGYTVVQSAMRLTRRGLPLDPRVIVVEGNTFNERKYVLRPDEIDSPEKFRRYTVDHAQQLRGRELYLYRVASFVERRLGLEPPHLPPQEMTDIRTLIPRVPLDSYRDALRRIVATARARGIAVVFLIVHDNPALTVPLQHADAAIRRGQARDAIDELTAAVTVGNDFAVLTRRHLVAAYEAAGDLEAARETARVAALRNVMGTAAITDEGPYQVAMREIARDAGATVVDVDPAALGGSAIYHDYAHLNAAGHAAASRLLEPVIRQALAARAG
jgi:lysophospholipase L1-like esterase